MTHIGRGAACDAGAERTQVRRCFRAHGMAWCGAEMADELGIHGQQGRELWLARNWAHVGTPASAHVGAVVVWSHHVGQIVGQENGQWVVRSGNDGGSVRSRARSLAGAIAIRDVGIGFGGSEVAGIDEQARGSVHIADIQRQHHYNASAVTSTGHHCGCTTRRCNRIATVQLQHPEKRRNEPRGRSICSPAIRVAARTASTMSLFDP